MSADDLDDDQDEAQIAADKAMPVRSGPRDGSPTLPLSFFEQLPKTDLHVHLDGSLRLATII